MKNGEIELPIEKRSEHNKCPVILDKCCAMQVKSARMKRVVKSTSGAELVGVDTAMDN